MSSICLLPTIYICSWPILPILELKGNVLITQVDSQFKQVIHFAYTFMVYCVFSLFYLLGDFENH